MIKHIVELQDGTILRSGVEEPAILSVNLTRSVNSETQLHPGSVCAAMAKIVLFGQNPMVQGSVFTLYEEHDDATWVARGKFIAEEAQTSGPNTTTITAYDRVTLLDQDVGDWLAQLDGWPYTLEELAGMVCTRCGVTLGSAQILNGDHPVQKLGSLAVTGRQLLQWIAQAACSYCFADGDGILQFGWYSETGAVYRPTDYCQGGLQMADYTTAFINRVKICAKEEDVGTVWPAAAGEANTYTVLGNPLLTADTATTLQTVAQNIYSRLRGVSFTPCAVKVPAGTGPEPGSIVTVVQRNGQSGKMYVMESRREGGLETFCCSSAATMDSTTVVNNQSYSALSGKILRLRTDVDGLAVENEDTKGTLAKLSLDLEGISTMVQAAQEENKTVLTTVSQTAEELTVAVQTILDNGVDRVTNSFGLTIDGSSVNIQRAGSEMENRLDETGMYVCRGDDVMLQANASGVIATDVSVRNFLVLGEHSRFEDYGSSRTACFYV